VIRVIVADPQGAERKRLAALLAAAGVGVVGQAADGREAVEQTLALKPDLLLLDLALPAGREALETIMARLPTPTLLLAADPTRQQEEAAVLLKRGALQVAAKPAAEDEQACPGLLEQLTLLAGIRVIRRPRRHCRQGEPLPTSAPLRPSVLGIGSSTGGPRGVRSLLRALPADFPGTVFVVQHIGRQFEGGFASWLQRECALRVRLATDGACYRPGEALIAPGGSHLTVSQGRTLLADTPPVHSCRPSIDVFFATLAREHGRGAVGVLLSGMGRDGALGLLRIRENGGATLVQDQKSSAIFGMPKAAIDLGAVDQVLPIERIPAAIARLFGP